MDLEDVTTVAVLGAGNMGHGIAEVVALGGYDVTMRDISTELVDDGYEQIEWSLDKLVETDQLSQEEADETLERITPLVDVSEAVGSVDLVIEAVPERMEIKRDVYQDVDEHAPDHAIFATNTSSLSITEISETTDRPEQCCGMHFFNPPIKMPLVEVISGDHTDEDTLDLVEALAADVGKTPVRVEKDSPGFIVNRVLVPLMNEAAWLVHEDEATIAEVDSTTKYGMGHPMGTFELADLVGLDVSFHVLEYLYDELGDAYEPCPLLEQKVETEAFGKKTGSGFYTYEDGSGVSIPTDEQFSLVEKRLLATMANEIAKLVDAGVAPPESIDEAVMLGAGFPEGPVETVEAYGLDSLLEILESAYESTRHDRYEPSELLRDRAADGQFVSDSTAVDSAESDESIDYDDIQLSIDEGVAKLVIDRPHRMNTITVDMIYEIDDALDRLEDDDSVRAILLIGAGDRAFSAGFDAATAPAGNGIEATELARLGQRVWGRFETLDVPVVAGIDGYCLGGGMELATSADLRIASERASFGQPEHSLGLMPGWGGTQRLSRIVGEGRAKEIIFTARKDYDAETMAAYGFVNDVVPVAEFEEAATELATDLADGPPLAQRFTKRAMHAGREDMTAGLEFEATSFGHLFTTDDLWEGLAAFQEDRDPEFDGT